MNNEFLKDIVKDLDLQMDDNEINQLVEKAKKDEQDKKKEEDKDKK